MVAGGAEEIFGEFRKVDGNGEGEGFGQT